MASFPNLLKTIVFDSSLAFILRVMVVPLGFVNNIVIARTFGAELMGTYFIALNLVGTISAFCSMGLPPGLLRFAAVLKAEGQFRGLRRLVWVTSGLVFSLGSIVALGIYALEDWFIECFHAPHLPGALIFVALALPVTLVVSLLRESVRALGGVRWVIIQDSLMHPCGFLILVLIFAYTAPNLVAPSQSLGFIYLTINLLGLGFLAWSPQSRRYIVRSSGSGGPQGSVIELLGYSWPIFLTSMLAVYLGKLDSLILGLFTSPQDVAYYGIATKIIPFVTFPLFAVNAVVPPLFAQFYKRGELKYLELVAQKTARWMYYVALPIALLIILLAPEILGFFGPDFIKARFALNALVLAQLVNVAAGSVGFILMMTDQQRTLLVLQAVIGIATIPLMIILTATFGLNGMALTSALGLAGINVLMAWAVWRRLRIKAFARQVQWANLGGLIGVGLFYLAQPFLGSILGAGCFSLSYLALVARPLKQEISGILRPQWLEAVK